MECISTTWYVVHTKPRKEILVERQLQDMGIVTYFPQIRVFFKKNHVEPLFPGYIFINPGTYGYLPGWRLWVPGIRKILGMDDGYLPLNQDLIESIRKKVEQINSDGGIKRFQKGDNVYIRSGPFAGLEAIFDGYVNPGDRVRILLCFLSGNTASLITKVQNVEKRERPKWRRTTRGRGRRIRYRN